METRKRLIREQICGYPAIEHVKINHTWHSCLMYKGLTSSWCKYRTCISVWLGGLRQTLLKFYVYISITWGCSSTYKIFLIIYIYWLYYIPIGVLYCIITVLPLPINNTNCTPKCLKPQHQRGRQCEHHSAEKRLGLQCWGALWKSDSQKLSASDWGWFGFIMIIQKSWFVKRDWGNTIEGQLTKTATPQCML
jgi:hypothetical protein